MKIIQTDMGPITIVLEDDMELVVLLVAIANIVDDNGKFFNPEIRSDAYKTICDMQQQIFDEATRLFEEKNTDEYTEKLQLLNEEYFKKEGKAEKAHNMPNKKVRESKLKKYDLFYRKNELDENCVVNRTLYARSREHALKQWEILEKQMGWTFVELIEPEETK